MKIVEASFNHEKFELTRPYSIAFRTTDSVSNFIVQLTDDEGLVGLGAAAPEPHVTGETDEMCAKALSEICVPTSFSEFSKRRAELAKFESTPAARAAGRRVRCGPYGSR